MNNINRVGIDLAKNVFQVYALDHRNKVLFNRRLSRKEFIVFMAKLPASKVYMEACYSSHYWGRTLQEMVAKIWDIHFLNGFVKPFRGWMYQDLIYVVLATLMLRKCCAMFLLSIAVLTANTTSVIYAAVLPHSLSKY